MLLIDDFLTFVLIKDKATRLLCHVYFYFSFQWPCLNVNELHIITMWITSFIKFVFRSIASLLSVCPSVSLTSFSIRRCPLQFVFYFIQWFKVNIQYVYVYIHLLTNDSLTQKVRVLLCPIRLTFITDVCFVHSKCCSTCSNTHMRIVINEKRNEDEKENFKRDTRHSNSIKQKGGREGERESNCRSFIQRD